MSTPPMSNPLADDDGNHDGRRPGAAAEVTNEESTRLLLEDDSDMTTTQDTGEFHPLQHDASYNTRQPRVASQHVAARGLQDIDIVGRLCDHHCAPVI